jgi:hypothetical protein
MPTTKEHPVTRNFDCLKARATRAVGVVTIVIEGVDIGGTPELFWAAS